MPKALCVCSIQAGAALFTVNPSLLRKRALCLALEKPFSRTWLHWKCRYEDGCETLAKVGAISRGTFGARIGGLANGNLMPEAATDPMLRARAALRRKLAALEKQVRPLAQDDPVCHRLMTMPGIGAVVARTFRAAVDDPARFRSSKRAGPRAGLTPSRNQSGERDVSGGITRAGGSI